MTILEQLTLKFNQGKMRSMHYEDDYNECLITLDDGQEYACYLGNDNSIVEFHCVC